MADAYRKYRERIFQSVTSMKKFCDAITAKTTLEDIEPRLEKLETAWLDFGKIDDKLLAISEEDTTAFPAFEELYYVVKAKLSIEIKKRQPARDDDISVVDLNRTLDQFVNQQKTFYEGSQSKGIKLPKINIESFGGDYSMWPSFHDLFVTSVHSNDSLSNVHKFQLLKGLLKDDAAALLRHITVTDANYTEAWDKLVDRYNKKKVIINSLINMFMDQRTTNIPHLKELRQLSNVTDEVVRGLRAIGPEAEGRDPWIIYLLLNLLDNETKQLWFTSIVDKDYPTLKEFLKFLNSRCDSLENCGSAFVRTSINSRPSIRSYIATEVENPNISCPTCNKQHYLYRCPMFKNFDVTQRRNLVNQYNVCYNCLRRGHSNNRCLFKSSCIICQQKHHTLLHAPTNPMGSLSTIQHTTFRQPVLSASSTYHQPSSASSTYHQPSSSSSTYQPSQNHPSQCKPLTNVHTTITESNSPSNINQSPATLKPTEHIHEQSTVCNVQEIQNFHAQEQYTYQSLLPTALVYGKDSLGNLQLVRALLDSGSQSSFVVESCVQRLGLKRTPNCVRVNGLGSTQASYTKGQVQLQLHSRFDNTHIITIEALIVEKISSNLPSYKIDTSDWKYIQGLKLADPTFNIPNYVDILIGADVFELLLNERIYVSNLPTAQNSRFGWLISGKINRQPEKNVQLLQSFHTSTEKNADMHEICDILKRFWEVEEVPVSSSLTSEELYCEDHFQSTHTRTMDGKYVVNLPFKTTKSELGNSINQAEHRLYAMERRFRKDPKLETEYKNFMKEYLQLNHMELISPEEANVPEKESFYLPHHAVFKESSTTTKLRVVFDGSCKSSTFIHISLNDTLLTGLNLQNNLINIIVRFRMHKIAFTSDIEKMYRQIYIHKPDTDFQRVLWRDDVSMPVQHFRLKTVTYGTSSAPYLATRTIKQLAIENEDMYPAAAATIKSDFYMDDLLTGAENETEAQILRDQITKIMKGGGFNLRKWKSNSTKLLQTSEQSIISKNPVTTPELMIDKTLGLHWNPEDDSFTFYIAINNIKNLTKRELLSITSKIFDPLGWISPTIILLKILIQQLWLLKLGWDDVLPNNILQQWKSIYDNFHHVEQIHIPRCLSPGKEPCKLQIHGFCDASEQAYEAVIYIRSEDCMGNITTNIVISKTKVAPIKQICLPRLELCGGVILCRLIKFLNPLLSFTNKKIYAWTDSSIVLHWLSSLPRRWKTFIGNRTSEILDILPRHMWSHVKSNDNPADYLTRGVPPKLLTDLKIWWNGPSWLQDPETTWPRDIDIINPMPLEVFEVRKPLISLQVVVKEDLFEHLFNRFSYLYKIKRTICYIKRFIFNCKSNANCRLKGHITVPELIAAEQEIIKNIQSREFTAEIASLNSQTQLNKKNKLCSLAPFIDQNGILRVGGRLENMASSFNIKHPVILPKGHTFNTLLIREKHVQHLHAGPTLLMNIIKQNYWILGLRNSVKHELKGCVICVRNRATTSNQLMGNLPASRVNRARPFERIGIDYAGPISIRTSKRRNSPTTKGYIALFVCLSIKAIHIELVSDMSSEAFIAALRRFIARRGIPAEIWCDNGTNFVGAAKELNTLKNQLTLQLEDLNTLNFFLQNNILFRFNPASAPHFGGLWEATVKSIKYHLRRVIGNATLNFEEMSTFLNQVEVLLNSRPLSCNTEDCTEIDVLTPAHFLIGEQLVAIPEPFLETIQESRLSKWQHIQNRVQGFWKSWSRDYLNTLQQRNKWQNKTDNIKVDDIVCIKEENIPPNRWLLGKIIQVFPGKDGLVRVASVKTARTILNRPIAKLCVLPVEKK